MPTKMSTIMTRVLKNPQARANMKAGALKRWAKAGERERQAARMKLALAREEVRAKMSKGAVRRHRVGK